MSDIRLAGTRQAAIDAEGSRLGLAHGMGGYLAGWAGKERKLRSAIGLTLFVLASPYGVIGSIALFFFDNNSTGLAYAVVGVAIQLALLTLWMYPGGVTRGTLFRYEDGIIEVLSRDPRLTVLRYADLATMTLNVANGYDGEYLASCVLRDHAGGELAVPSGRYGEGACGEVVGIGRNVLTDRLLGPLTRRLDQGLSVTLGPVTVDGAGLTVTGGREGRDTWTIPWAQLRKVSASTWGQRLVVNGGRWYGKTVRLDGQPNSFLAQDVISYAARLAGVDVSTG
jgi:hypothetical protein